MIDRRFFPTFGIVLAAVTLVACQPSDAHVVQVTARDYAFQVPDSIPSGWSTFRMENRGEEHHFLLLNRLPDGKTFQDYRREVVAPFDSVWHVLKTGAADKAEAGELLGRLLPDWYGSVRPMGGPGLVAPGEVAWATMELDPGTYVMECYVKTTDGTFHTSLGMQRLITVTGESSGASAPDADIEITLSNFQIAVEGEVTPGEHTVAVHFEEHPEFGLGNDVHVVRLEAGTDLDEVVRWMDWMNVDGLRAPAPARFVGGTQEMPVGYTAYFTIELLPGRYAWISEVTAADGMVKEFTVR